MLCGYLYISTIDAAAVAQWVRAFAPQTEGWGFEFQPQQNLVVKTGRDSFTVKHSAIHISVTGPGRREIINGRLLKNPHCSTVISVEKRSEFVPLHQISTAAVALWVRELASHVEDWVFEYQPQQT